MQTAQVARLRDRCVDMMGRDRDSAYRESSGEVANYLAVSPPRLMILMSEWKSLLSPLRHSLPQVNLVLIVNWIESPTDTLMALKSP